MAEIAKSFETKTGDHLGSAGAVRCTVLVPPPKIACRWDGALRARLNGEPLEVFLRSNFQNFSVAAPNLLVERLEVACMFIIEPVLPHQTYWRLMCRLEYFEALGVAIARVSRGLGDAVQEQRLWRVAALRAMGRLLAPTMGIDMAASVAAVSIAPFGCPRTRLPNASGTLEELTVKAVMSGSEVSVTELRRLVGEHLGFSSEVGAAEVSTAPFMLTISAEPPSNH